jgi:hypothetical protein
MSTGISFRSNICFSRLGLQSLTISFLLSSCYDSNPSDSSIDTDTDSPTEDEGGTIGDEIQEDVVEDDVTDEEWPCVYNKIGGDLQLTFHNPSSATARRPVPAFSSSEIGLAWLDTRDTAPSPGIYFNRLSWGMEVLQDDALISEIEGPGFPSMIFSSASESYDAVWQIDDGILGIFYIVFSRVSSDGTKIGHDSVIVEENDGEINNPMVAHSSSGHGVVWCGTDFSTGNVTVNFLSLDQNGDPSGAPLIVDNILGSDCMLSLASSGDRFAIAWEDRTSLRYNLYVQMVSPDGTFVNDKRLLNPMVDCQSPTIAFAEDGYVVACWGGLEGDPRINDIFFIELSLEGNVMGSERKMSDGDRDLRSPMMVFSGSEIGIVWIDYEALTVLLRRYGVDGREIQGDIFVTGSADITNGAVPVVSAGSNYIVAWDDGKNIFVSKIGCTP